MNLRLLPFALITPLFQELIATWFSVSPTTPSLSFPFLKFFRNSFKQSTLIFHILADTDCSCNQQVLSLVSFKSFSFQAYYWWPSVSNCLNAIFPNHQFSVKYSFQLQMICSFLIWFRVWINDLFPFSFKFLPLIAFSQFSSAYVVTLTPPIGFLTIFT